MENNNSTPKKRDRSFGIPIPFFLIEFSFLISGFLSKLKIPERQIDKNTLLKLKHMLVTLFGFHISME